MSLENELRRVFCRTRNAQPQWSEAERFIAVSLILWKNSGPEGQALAPKQRSRVQTFLRNHGLAELTGAALEAKLTSFLNARPGVRALLDELRDVLREARTSNEVPIDLQAFFMKTLGQNRTLPVTRTAPRKGEVRANALARFALQGGAS